MGIEDNPFLYAVQEASQLSPQDWMAANVEIPPAPEIKSTDQDQQLAEAYLAYNETNYREALEKMLAIEDDIQGSRRMELDFYKGMSLFTLGEFAKAKENLDNISTGPYYEMAEWYSALSLVKQGAIPEAIRALDNIRESGGFYKEQAKALLQSLE